MGVRARPHFLRVSHPLNDLGVLILILVPRASVNRPLSWVSVLVFLLRHPGPCYVGDFESVLPGTRGQRARTVFLVASGCGLEVFGSASSALRKLRARVVASDL